MAAVFVHPATFSYVPYLNSALARADRYLSAVAVPSETTDGVRVEVAELKDPVIVCVPKVETGVQGN